MKSFALLAALALTTTLSVPAVADGCGGSNCVVQQPSDEAMQDPKDGCSSNGCATPRLTPFKIACDNGSCATEEFVKVSQRPAASSLYWRWLRH